MRYGQKSNHFHPPRETDVYFRRSRRLARTGGGCSQTTPSRLASCPPRTFAVPRLLRSRARRGGVVVTAPTQKNHVHLLHRRQNEGSSKRAGNLLEPRNPELQSLTSLLTARLTNRVVACTDQGHVGLLRNAPPRSRLSSTRPRTARLLNHFCIRPVSTMLEATAPTRLKMGLSHVMSLSSGGGRSFTHPTTTTIWA